MVLTTKTDTVSAVGFRNLRFITPEPFAASWAQLSARLSFSKGTVAKDRRSLWSPAIYRDGTTRGNSGVEAITCLVVDMDGEAFDFAHLDGLEWLAYTTWSHRPDKQHWHLVLPLKHPVPVSRWSEAWARLHERINVVGDPKTKDPARIFYLPQHAPGHTPESKSGTGEFLDPGIGELFVPRPVIARSPRTVRGQSKPPKHYWDAEGWWDETQDLSRFAGMSEAEIATALLREFRELRKSWILD
jgi:hypothetical protein